MSKEVIQTGTNPNALNQKPAGLVEPVLLGARGYHEIDCPHCAEMVCFYPAKLIWDSDDDFEFCNVDCPECKQSFELNAVAGTLKYEFFTT